jgi:hypothetical protein
VIRGAIEVVEAGKVSGWIHSSAGSVRDQLIIGFVGARCVGTGKIDKLRPDLLAAGLGDGYCGFDFPIKFLPEEEPGSLVVRLEHSDVALLQRGSRVFGDNVLVTMTDEMPDLGAVPPASVTWMQDHGWLETHEHDFLKAIQGAGVCERALRATRFSGDGKACAKPEIFVRKTLGVYMLSHVDVLRTHVSSFAELVGHTARASDEAVSVIGLWSEAPTTISVAERSHIGPRASRGRLLRDIPPGGIDYQFGPDQVLFLHRDCSFAPHAPETAAGIVLLTAVAKRQRARGAFGRFASAEAA